MRWSLAAVAATCSGCLLLTNLDGLAEGEPSVTPDGATPPDGAAPADGGEGGTGGSRWCATRSAALCDDFDDAVLSPAWRLDKSQGASIVLANNADASSHPGCLVAQAQGTDRSAVASRTVSGSASEAHASSDIRVDELDSSAYANLTSLYAAANGQEYYAQVGIRRAGPNVELAIEEYAGPVKGSGAHWSNATFPLGKWVRIGLDVVAQGNSGTIGLTLDGVTVKSIPTTLAALPDVNQAKLMLGIVFVSNDRAAVAFDNVTMDVR